MRGEPPLDDDPVIARVAAVRPPIPEEELSPESARARAIAERVLAGTPSAPESRSPPRWMRPRWALPRLGLALAPVVVIVALLVSGTFSGPGSSGTQPAAADETRAAVRALSASPGTIFVEDQTYVSGPMVHGHPYSIHQVTETPAGAGAQNVLTSYSDPSQIAPREHPVIAAWSYVGGEQSIYIPADDTIHVSSIWGPYLHPGPRPRTFVYRYAPGASFYATHPVLVTARERSALLAGRAAILLSGKRVGSKVRVTGPTVRPPDRAPDYAQQIRDSIAHHHLRFAGRTTVHGRAALTFTAKTSDATAPRMDVYLDPGTHLPFHEVDSVGTRRQQVIDLSLRKLPISPSTERLLSLSARHPTARIDHNHRDYLRAAHGTQIYPG